MQKLININYKETNLSKLFKQSKRSKEQTYRDLKISRQSWLKTYQNDYGKLKISHVMRISEKYNIPICNLISLLKKDIKQQNNES